MKINGKDTPCDEHEHTEDGARVYTPEDIAKHVVSEVDGLKNSKATDEPIIAYAVVAVHERADNDEHAMPSVSVMGHKGSAGATMMTLSFGQLTLSAAVAEKDDAEHEAMGAVYGALKSAREAIFGDMDIPSDQTF